MGLGGAAAAAALGALGVVDEELAATVARAAERQEVTLEGAAARAVPKRRINGGPRTAGPSAAGRVEPARRLWLRVSCSARRRSRRRPSARVVKSIKISPRPSLHRAAPAAAAPAQRPAGRRGGARRGRAGRVEARDGRGSPERRGAFAGLAAADAAACRIYRRRRPEGPGAQGGWIFAAARGEPGSAPRRGRRSSRA